jgi:glycosyltransferase involved in cell wall biosynthesis
MDDVPAGPTSPRPRRPSLSVVVPVRNGGRTFERCLQRLRDSRLTDFELIVVDDGSTDDSAAIARKTGAIVVQNPTPQGPAAARNRGAQAATAPLVFFLDADVAVHPETLGRALARFDTDPGLSALFGSYDDAPAAPGLVSQYRNLLHHFVHQHGPFVGDVRPAHTFWTGCGTIRRDVFLEFGGFDPRLYPRPAIEDIELGYRLTRAGHRIILARDVLATHQ